MDPNQNPSTPNTKQQVVDTIRNATNVLVTVSANPSVDQLAACLGLALMLNKLEKHATAIFSGQAPSTIEFLQPEKTFERNTDSLRDFIISLDRSKADHFRYKIEDNVVKIFITPLRTSLSEKDLQFSQGDYNVDVVVALGVDKREHLDQAITSHGRILHDAAVIGISCGRVATDVGSINWHEPTASSLCEMLVSISESFQSGLLDSQMATAFLTGIVAETNRFSNPKTTPKVMTMSAQLMAAGANQQLIATKLAPPAKAILAEPIKKEAEFDVPKTGQKVDSEDSESIALHTSDEVPKEPPVEVNAPAPAVDLEEPLSSDDAMEQIRIDDAGKIHDASPTAALEQPDELGIPKAAPSPSDVPLMRGREKVIQPLSTPTEGTKPDNVKSASNYIYDKPDSGGTFTASTDDDARQEQPAPGFAAPGIEPTPILSHDSVIEDSTTVPSSNEDAARKAVVDAVSSIDYQPIVNPPKESLNAAPIDINEPKAERPTSDGSNPPPVVPPPLPPTPQQPTDNNGNDNSPELTLPTPN